MPEMKTLTINGKTYEVVDEAARLAIDGITPEAIGAAHADRVVNPTMLDNAYFVNPVDHRAGYVVPPNIMLYQDEALSVEQWTNGTYESVTFISDTVAKLTKYPYYCKRSDCVRGYTGAGYTIDRWRISGSNAHVILESDGIRYIADTAWGSSFEQVFESPLPAGTYTFSAYIDECTGGNGFIAFDQHGNWISSAVFETKVGLVSYTFTVNADIHHICFAGNVDSTNVKIKAAKLELGTQQTLAHQDENGNWVLNEIPKYDEELLKCCMSKADSSDTYANNKVTPAAINAVNKSGDTMTGNLAIDSPYGQFITKHSDGSSASFMSHNQRASMVVKNRYDVNGQNERGLNLYNSNEGSNGKDITRALQMYDVIDGVTNWYNVLHTGNSNMTRLVSADTTPTVNNEINWTYK